jgi:hypothetical protein
VRGVQLLFGGKFRPVDPGYVMTKYAYQFAPQFTANNGPQPAPNKCPQRLHDVSEACHVISTKKNQPQSARRNDPQITAKCCPQILD